MLTYQHEERKQINAPPAKVFAILAGVIHHDNLAGIGEVKSIRMIGDGDIGVGTEWEADEEITVGRSTQKFIARSTVPEFDPPRVFSWTSRPPSSVKPVPRRIQWRYRLAPDAGGTQVVEQVEVDMGQPDSQDRLPRGQARRDPSAPDPPEPQPGSPDHPSHDRCE